MKRHIFRRGLRLAALATLLVVLLPTTLTYAAAIAADGFEGYIAGSDLNGNNGGTGWGGMWNSVAWADVSDVAISYAISGQALGGGNSVAVSTTTSNTDRVMSRPLSAPQNGEVFARVVFQFDNTAIDGDDFFSLWFNDADSGAYEDHKPEFGIKEGKFYARTVGTLPHYASIIPAAGETYLLVARFSKSGTCASNPDYYDSIDLWISPDYADLGSPDVSVTGECSATSPAAINYVGLRVYHINADDTLRYDALQLGTSWDDVVPAPEEEPEPEPEPAPAPAPVVLGHANVLLSGAPTPAAVTGTETILWTFTIANPTEEGTWGLTFRADVPEVLNITGVTASQGVVRPLEGQTVWVDLGNIGPGASAIVTIETTFSGAGSAAEALAGMHARVLPNAAGKGVSKGQRQEAGDLICVTGAVAEVAASACVTLFPEELPLTGSQPILSGWAWALAGVSLTAAAALLWRRQQALATI
jgi:hypothetical protein